ncbi:hypothetical protein [Ensifer sp. Root31]|uniref:hypothetical protein n=1 Tax=Ensifer sp. Root31 TaxID=1736512 RepID=UPI001FCE0CFB|nr:hypothetical protein [Ensifer sp. Root31]
MTHTNGGWHFLVGLIGRSRCCCLSISEVETFYSSQKTAAYSAGVGRLREGKPDGGWKFTIGDPNDRREPYFSEPYETVDIAKTEALRHINRLPSLHQSLPEQRREKRRQKEEEQREEFVSNEPEIIAALAASADAAANVTELRKIERKAETQLRHVDRVVGSIAIYGSDEAIEKALIVQKEARELLENIRMRVAELKEKPRNNKAGPSAS